MRLKVSISASTSQRGMQSKSVFMLRLVARRDAVTVGAHKLPSSDGTLVTTVVGKEKGV